MRKWGIVFALAASAALSACVQTKQYADPQFTLPQGNYKLLVLRPDVHVGSLTTGGMVEPRADWTEQARTNIIAALRAQQAALGGNLTIVERRNQLPGVAEQELADVERLNFAVDQSIVLHKYLGDYLPTKRGRGLDWTLGADAVKLGEKTGYDYALFLHAEDSVASRGRVVLGVIGLAGCIVGFCAPNVGGAEQLDYASLVDLKTGEVVWFNVVDAASQVPGIKFGELRTPEGAAQMIERLIGRMKPGRPCAAPRRRADVRRLPRAHAAARCWPAAALRLLRSKRVSQRASPARRHGSARRPGVQADRQGRAGPVGGDGPGRGGDRGLEPAGR